MKKINILIICGIILALIICSFFYLNMDLTIKPIVMVKEQYVEDTTIEKGFYENIQNVLNFYNVQYNTDKEGRVRVSRKIYRDKELWFNYTNKARDPIWLNEHK